MATETPEICAGRNPWRSMYMDGEVLHESMTKGWTVHVQSTQGLPNISYDRLGIEANVRKVE